MMRHIIRSRDLTQMIHKSNNTWKLQYASTETCPSYAIICKHRNLPKLHQLFCQPSHNQWSPNQLLAVLLSKLLAGFCLSNISLLIMDYKFLVIKYRFVDYGLLVFDYQLPHYELLVIANNKSLLVWCYL